MFLKFFLGFSLFLNTIFTSASAEPVNFVLAEDVRLETYKGQNDSLRSCVLEVYTRLSNGDVWLEAVRPLFSTVFAMKRSLKEMPLNAIEHASRSINKTGIPREEQFILQMRDGKPSEFKYIRHSYRAERVYPFEERCYNLELIPNYEDVL